MRQISALLLALTLFTTAAAADSDYSTRFIELGMDGDLAGARVVLSEWAQARPDDARLNTMRELLVDWETDVAQADPYLPLGDALMKADYAGARAVLADAAGHAAATDIQQAAFAAWIERFENHDQGPSLGALQQEYTEFELQRSSLQAREVTGAATAAANDDRKPALADFNVLLESVAADLERNEAR